MLAQLSATLWSTIVGSGTLVRPLIQLLKFPFSVPPKKFFDTARSLQPRLQIVGEAVAYGEHDLPGSERQLVDTLAERSVFEEFAGALSAFSSKWPLISPVGRLVQTQERR